ncbi:MAG: YbaB/EbfC family nucleoid-associated protein [Coriobacteriaceae bacterium]|nr:YbaB/EbfC family nucleoid-associated protein [Coriobacteriaceae bacterium]
MASPERSPSRVKPDMNKMLKQAQKMQADMARVQEELKDEMVEASAGGGAVLVAMSGDFRVLSVKIDPAAAEDVEMLQDLTAAAVNEAIRAAQQLADRKMSAITGAFGGMPGLM